MKLTTAKRICKRLSNQYGIINPPELIPLKYSRRGNHAALGSYDSDRNIVEINKYAMELWNTERIQEIIQHELIHARCYQDFGHCGHGARFKLLCDLCGVEGDARLATSKREG